jgi:predicted nucleic acid-binding protein
VADPRLPERPALSRLGSPRQTAGRIDDSKLVPSLCPTLRQRTARDGTALTRAFRRYSSSPFGRLRRSALVMVRAFLDTNELVYADDADAGAKQAKAQALMVSALATGDAVISTQVLQEYFSVATRKLAVGAEAAQKKVEILAALVAVTIDADHVIESIKLHRLYNNLTFWDALILHAARRAGCDRLITEDLQAGQRIEGVEIVDPFA